jgi:peptidyl-prolyl cis-trans isomerase SurA
MNVDATEWKEGVVELYPSKVDNSTQIIKIMEVRQPEPKTFKEARGVVTSGYQAELEAQWLEQLREKYSVTVDEKLLNKVKENYKN